MDCMGVLFEAQKQGSDDHVAPNFPPSASHVPRAHPRNLPPSVRLSRNCGILNERVLHRFQEIAGQTNGNK